MRLTISLPTEIAFKAKEHATKNGATFSGLIRKKLEEELKVHGEQLD